MAPVHLVPHQAQMETTKRTFQINTYQQDQIATGISVENIH